MAEDFTGRPRLRFFLGLALIAVGFLLLLPRIFGVEAIYAWVPLAAGAVLVAVGVVSGATPLLLPGLMLAGVGAGIALAYSLLAPLEADRAAGIVITGFAAGILGYSVVTIKRRPFRWWPLAVGIPVGAFGAVLVASGAGARFANLVAVYWPAVAAPAVIVLVLVARYRSRP